MHNGEYGSGHGWFTCGSYKRYMKEQISLSDDLADVVMGLLQCLSLVLRSSGSLDQQLPDWLQTSGPSRANS